MLIAQAQHEHLTLVTADENIPKYAVQTAWQQKTTRTMTTIINIETSTYQLPLSFRWVLVLPCLLVMGSLQSCRTAAISATALDLNNYQTGKTLQQGEITTTVQMAYAPSVIGYVGGTGYISQLPMAVVALTGIELGVSQGWTIGLAGQISSTTLLLDMDAGFKGFVKTALTDSASPIALALLLNGGILWGTESNTKDVRNYSMWPFGAPIEPLRDPSMITHTAISSQVNRLGIALPMSWTAFRVDSIAQAASYSLLSDVDLIVTPSFTVIHQNLFLQDSSYRLTSYPYLLIPLQSSSRMVRESYLIPSLSIGLSWNVASAQIFPELTASWTKTSLTFGFGICFRAILAKP